MDRPIVGPVLDEAGHAKRRLETKYFVEAMAKADARIAALEAQVARLTKPATVDEARRAVHAYYNTACRTQDRDDMAVALNAFLEGRKG